MEDSHIFFRHRDLGKMSGALTTTLRKVRQPLPGNEQDGEGQGAPTWKGNYMKCCVPPVVMATKIYP